MPALSDFSYRPQYLRAPAILALALAVAACGKGAPSGQTVATVNGEGITQSELNLELALSGAPAANWKALRPQVLQALIDRKLLVQAAARDGIDKLPDMVLAVERAKALAIVDRTIQSIAAGARRPATAADIETYLAAHPALGASRRILSVEQIRFPMPSDAGAAAALGPVKTMTDLAQVLTDRGVDFQRGATEVDTATLDDKARRQLLATTGGEPLIVLDGTAAVANHVTGARATAPSAAATAELARQRLAGEQSDRGIRQRQAALRAAAKIEYAKDFAPKAGPAPK